MLRAPIWVTVFVLFAGGSLAAPSLHVPLQAPRSERPAPAGDWSLDGLVPPIGEEATAEEIVVARGGRGGGRGGHRGGGGGRGGGMAGGNRGGFSAGHNRNVNRNVNANRNVNVDRNVNVHGGGGGWDDDDHAAGAAFLGAAVGAGIGSRIANDQNNN
jgi:hypothetical protein